MRFAPLRTAVPIVLAAMLLQASSLGQGLDYVRSRYTKLERYIPMRDGVRLYTAVYVPKDRSRTWPILLIRTPYSIAPYGSDQYRENLGPSELFAKDGYIFVYQDVRGRFMSEGEFEHMRPHKPVRSGPKDIDESTDTWDTIEWLLKNVPGHNGLVGQWGISYPGFYTAAAMVDPHPAVKAVSPQAPVADWFIGDDWHHNGAFFLAHAFGWFSGAGWPFTGPTTQRPGQPIDRGTSDGYEFFLRLGPLRNVNAVYFKNGIPFWNEMMAHETYDEFWKARNLRRHFRNIKPAVMTVGGWFDAENLFGALETYKKTEANSPGAFNILVMGPWVHGGWARGDGSSLGAVRFDARTAEHYRERIEFPFFSHFLKGAGSGEFPEAQVFETGTNQWRQFAAWPPSQAAPASLYLHPEGRLSFDPPPAGGGREFEEYVSDPRKPVPLMTGIAPGMAREYMIEDQRSAGRRPDVLVYQTGALEEDVTVAGPVFPSLFVSTTGTDSDWIVKLIDVYPDRYPSAEGAPDPVLGGYQQLVRGDVLRGKFRNSFEKPEPFTPGEPTRIEFEMPDIFHTFRRGHRIMVQIQSTWFPLVGLNPQEFVDINNATETDFQAATQRVFHSPAMPSQIRVRLLGAR